MKWVIKRTCGQDRPEFYIKHHVFRFRPASRGRPIAFFDSPEEADAKLKSLFPTYVKKPYESVYNDLIYYEVVPETAI